jgi:hypothetical protein
LSHDPGGGPVTRRPGQLRLGLARTP